MKIWLMTSETPLFNPGGIARYVDNFARYLAAEGHEVTVFGRDVEKQDREIVPGYTYVSVVPRWDLLPEKMDSPHPDEHPAWPYNILDYWGAFSYQMAQRVLEEIRSSGPPAVIESQEYTALPYYLLQRKLTGENLLSRIPIVVNAHSPDFYIREYNEEPRYQFPHYWTGRLEMFCLLAADSVICPSQYLARQLEKKFGGSLKIHHFPLPWTDPQAFAAAKPRIDSRKVIYSGRLEVRKGVLKLLEACDRLWESGLDFELHLIGADTPYFPRGTTVGSWIAKRHGAHLRQGRLHLRGPLEFGALMEELMEAPFTVIPSLWENWPNTCIEAMSLGKVVVASRHGGQAEMIGENGEAGFAFSWEREGDFERAFRAALTLNGEQREQMGYKASERIRQICSPEVVLPARLRHFHEVLSPELPKRFPFVNRHLRNSSAKAGWVGGEEVENRVSVVIPYYNLGGYVREAVASVIAADWPDKEIILVDDGSTEKESLETLAEMEKEILPGLRIQRQENRGLARARNVGARLATGQYLLLLDADDLIEPDFIRRCVTVLERFDNVHIVYSWERYIEGSHDIYPCWNFEFPYLLGHNMTCPVSLMYRKSYLSFGPSKPELAYNFEDFELWINLVKQGCGGVALPEPLCRYRVRTGSMWQASPREQHLYLQDLISRFHPELFREYGAELFNLQNANGASQKWVKPSANSPYDEFEKWSREQITWLQEEAKKWWQTSTELDERLKKSESEKVEIWKEKNALLDKLNGEDAEKS